MIKRAVLALVLASLSTLSTGCLGRSGLVGEVKHFNLRVVENRWGREGLFLGMQALWVYRAATILDLLIFNTIEFWSGTNLINGESALVDVPVSEAQQISSHEVERARAEFISEDAAKLHVDFVNGDRMAFDVLRDGDDYTVTYLGRVFYQGKVDSAR